MKGKMKAQIYYKEGDIRLEERDIPQIGEDEVLVRVKACGICGSDIAYYFGRSPLETASGKGPLVLGHEFSGEVAALGAKSEKAGILKLGDRVLGNPVQQCNACAQCAKGNVNLCVNKDTSGVSVDGAFAQYIVMRHTHLFKIPEGLSYEAASLCEPLACACYGIKKLDVQLGDFVVIFGPGPIGLMQAQMIRALGAGKIVMVGVLDFGLEKALKMGADYVINTQDSKSPYYCADLKAKIAQLSGGLMADRVIVPTSAKPALRGALEVAGCKAVIVYFGLPSDTEMLEVPLLDLMVNDKSLLVSWQAPYTWDIAIKAIENGKIELEELITHKFPLENLEDGLKLMDDDSISDKIKTVITID